MNRIVRIVLLREVPEQPELREQWNSLAAQVPHSQVFYTYEWALALQRAYGATLHPLLFLAYGERDELCGVAALAVDDAGQVSFLCATTGDYCDFLSLPDARLEFVEMVFSELRKQGFGEMTLTNLPADSAAPPDGWHSRCRNPPARCAG